MIWGKWGGPAALNVIVCFDNLMEGTEYGKM